MTQLPVPTPVQIEWHERELGMFIHWTLDTFLQAGETDPHKVPLSRIDPVDFNADQWVDVAVSMGAKYIVFVAKHATGFCLWNSRTTNFSIAHTPWRGGGGDILRELADASRRRGIALGVYLSPRDDNEHAKVSGICPTSAQQAAYNALYRAQLTELLTEYGDMCEVWFDGSTDAEVGDIIREHAPNAVVFQSANATIRWVGNEDGIATYPAWNSVAASDAVSGGATNRHGDPNGGMWLPLECDARIRESWFWSPTNETTLKSLDELMEMYYRSVGHGAVLLLNHTPDPTGRIPEPDVARAAEFGREIANRFANPLADAAGGDVIEVQFDTPTLIDHTIAMEEIALGERVRAYAIEGLVGADWCQLATGTAIGHKKIDRFAPVAVSAIRFRVLKSASPVNMRFAAFHTGAPFVTTVAAPPSSIVIGEWGSEIFYGVNPASPLTLEFGISGACTEAREYDIAFAQSKGAHNLVVDSLVLVHNGQEYPKWVTTGDQPNTFIVTLTEINDAMRIRAIIRSPHGPDTYGTVLATPRVAG